MKHPFRVILMSAITLLTVSILLLTNSGCSTTIRTEDTEVLEIPSIDYAVSVEKPSLIAIPSLNGIDFTPEQTNALSAVFEAYNTNLGNLIIYAEDLEQTYSLKIQYLQGIIDILNNNSDSKR